MELNEKYFQPKDDKGGVLTIEQSLMPDEKILWQGKPQKKAFVLNNVFKMLPIALLWIAFDVFFIVMLATNADGFPTAMIAPICIFFVLHLAPVLHADYLVGAFLRELEFVDGHDDCRAPRFCKVSKYSQQVDLVADVEIRRGLIEHKNARVLSDRACEHDALALPVAHAHEIAFSEFFHVSGSHGGAHALVVVAREHA